MRRIRGRSALVTGAASGIGRAIALRLADEGARLFLVDCNPIDLNPVADEIRRRGAAAIACNCDLADPAAISAAVAHVRQAWGGVEILVNNAGITYYGRTAEMPAEAWRRVVAVNLLAPMQLTHELLPTLLASDEAHVLNVASFFGLVGMPRIAAYNASKFGLAGFSESLRAEHARTGLGVTALCPGFVDTNLFNSAPVGCDRLQPQRPPRWMLASPERVAECAIRAIYRNQGVVVMQSYARLAWWVKRLAPWALELASRLQRSRAKPAAAEVQPDPSRRAA